MTTRVTPPPAIDLLADAIERVRPGLDRSHSVTERIHNLWAGVRAARHRGASGVVANEFRALAEASGLIADLGKHGNADVDHVILWALRNRNPFH
jgi:hypothetical protein